MAENPKRGPGTVARSSRRSSGTPAMRKGEASAKPLFPLELSLPLTPLDTGSGDYVLAAHEGAPQGSRPAPQRGRTLLPGDQARPLSAPTPPYVRAATGPSAAAANGRLSWHRPPVTSPAGGEGGEERGHVCRAVPAGAHARRGGACRDWPAALTLRGRRK